MITDKRCSVRFKNELYEEIKARAAVKNITESEFIRKCVESQLASDLEMQDELVATIGSFKSELLNVKREVKIFSSMFVYWLKYYFTLSGSEFDELPDGDVKKLAFAKGEIRKNKFVEMYKKENKSYKSIYEQIVADFLTEKEQPENFGEQQ